MVRSLRAAKSPKSNLNGRSTHQFLGFRDEKKVVVSGVVTKGNADFKAEAVKVAHEKPLPQHDKRPPGSGAKMHTHIQQPRKQ